MDTTERVVEAYCRYVKGWATIPNIRCAGQYEIDLLAIDPASLDRYHIEVGVSIASGFSKVTDKPFSQAALKSRVGGPGQRTTMGYFIERKFELKEVRDKLKDFGFKRGKYRRIIVGWDFDPGAEKRAKRHHIELWRFGELLMRIADEHAAKSSYFMDDTVRTLQLLRRAEKRLG